jgi:hypothetical protein
MEHNSLARPLHRATEVDNVGWLRPFGFVDPASIVSSLSASQVDCAFSFNVWGQFNLL